jgi:hypothetical protein
MRTQSWSKTLKGKDHLGDLIVDGRAIFNCELMEIGLEGVNWIHVTVNRDQK